MSSACARLNRGQDLNCEPVVNRKYIQRAILMNRDDINQIYLLSDYQYNRVGFNLKPGFQGYAFTASDVANVIQGSFNKSEDRGIITYQHRIQIPVIGVTEFKKVLLKQLDNTDLFCALQFNDETVEIYGFNYGLQTENYNFSASNGLGGIVLSLTSRVDEYEPPLIYYPFTLADDPAEDVVNEAINFDFDNLFQDLPDFLCGDFNRDFNNDFNNECDGSSTASQSI